jgi:hypothetical protein
LAVGSRIEVDTNIDVPAVWFHLNLKSVPGKYTDYNRINVESLDINIDSMPVNSSPFNVGQPTPLYKSWSKFTITRGLDTKFDTVMMCDPLINTSEISFSLNKAKKEIWSYLYSKIYNDRLWSTYRDSVGYDTVIVTSYDTVWINGNMEVHEKKTKQVQPVHLKVEQVKRAKDTLWLRGKIRLQY